MYGANVLRSILLTASWLFGMGIIEYPRGQQHHVISFLHSTTCLLGYYVVVYFSFNGGYHHITTFTETSYATVTLLYYGNLIITTCSIILGWKRSKEIYTCSVKSDALYKLMTKTGITNKNCKNFLNTIWSAISHFLILIVIVTSGGLILFKEDAPWQPVILMSITRDYPLILMLIAEATFLFTIRTNGELLKALNNMLQNAITATYDSPQHKRIVDRSYPESKLYSEGVFQADKSIDIKTMRTIKSCHLELVKICLDAAKSYGMQILLTVILAFTVITGALYNAYQILFHAKLPTSDIVRAILTCSCWFLYYALTIINFCSICNKVSNEALKTGDIISKLYDEKSTSKEVRVEIRNFNLQMIQNPLIFTALGFFTLDHSLIHGMASSITTYLVILIQLSGIAEKRNKETIMEFNATSVPAFATSFINDS